MNRFGNETGVPMKVGAISVLIAVGLAAMAHGSKGWAASSPLPATSIRAGAVSHAWDHYDLYVSSWGYGFQGPTMAGSVDHGVIPAGEDLRVFYRKTGKDLGMKSEITRVELQWRIEDQAIQTQEFEARGTDPSDSMAVIQLPESARGELQLWFRVHGSDGRLMYDSLYGANYRASIVGVDLAVVSFPGPTAGGAWPDPILDGNLTPYSRVRVRYDFSRMGALGAPTEISSFHVQGFVTSFDTQNRIIEKDSFRVDPIPSRSGYFNVPRNTERLELYFIGSAGARSWYDSSFGRNFSFRVE